MKKYSVCGTDCTACYCFGKMCSGCNECSGKVFHCGDGKACAIYDCCVNLHNYANCLQCSKLPCEVWQKNRDPKFTDKEFAENTKNRINNMKSENNG